MICRIVLVLVLVLSSPARRKRLVSDISRVACWGSITGLIQRDAQLHAVTCCIS